MTIEKVEIGDIKRNPSNPRTIKDDKFRKLVKSIKDFPEMLQIRPIVVDDNMVVLGGNMRLKACIEAGLSEVFIIKASTLTEDQKLEFIIKDNVGYGEWEWEVLTTDWDTEKLDSWGLDVLDGKVDKSEEGDEIKVEKSLQILPKNEYVIIYAPEGSDEWEDLKSIFGCRLVRQGGCKVGSSSDKVGTGLERVFNVAEFKKRLNIV
jgi:hypothetical protein